jgi:hypothetical protein
MFKSNNTKEILLMKLFVIKDYHFVLKFTVHCTQETFVNTNEFLSFLWSNIVQMFTFSYSNTSRGFSHRLWVKHRRISNFTTLLYIVTLL